MIFLQLVLNVMLTKLPIRRWIPLKGLILVSVFPETLPIDFLLHDEVRHALRRGFWDALERTRR